VGPDGDGVLAHLLDRRRAVELDLALQEDRTRRLPACRSLPNLVAQVDPELACGAAAVPGRDDPPLPGLEAGKFGGRLIQQGLQRT
jgi:hypothetical protein